MEPKLSRQMTFSQLASPRERVAIKSIQECFQGEEPFFCVYEQIENGELPPLATEYKKKFVPEEKYAHLLFSYACRLNNKELLQKAIFLITKENTVSFSSYLEEADYLNMGKYLSLSLYTEIIIPKLGGAFYEPLLYTGMIISGNEEKIRYVNNKKFWDETDIYLYFEKGYPDDLIPLDESEAVYKAIIEFDRSNLLDKLLFSWKDLTVEDLKPMLFLANNYSSRKCIDVIYNYLGEDMFPFHKLTDALSNISPKVLQNYSILNYSSSLTKINEQLELMKRYKEKPSINLIVNQARLGHKEIVKYYFEKLNFEEGIREFFSLDKKVNSEIEFPAETNNFISNRLFSLYIVNGLIDRVLDLMTYGVWNYSASGWTSLVFRGNQEYVKKYLIYSNKEDLWPKLVNWEQSFNQ